MTRVGRRSSCGPTRTVHDATRRYLRARTRLHARRARTRGAGWRALSEPRSEHMFFAPLRSMRACRTLCPCGTASQSRVYPESGRIAGVDSDMCANRVNGWSPRTRGSERRRRPSPYLGRRNRSSAHTCPAMPRTTTSHRHRGIALCVHTRATSPAVRRFFGVGHDLRPRAHVRRLHLRHL